MSKLPRLVSREHKSESSPVVVNGVAYDFAMIAGPCTVETEEQTLRIAQQVAATGVKLFRGGAYKPRTSPYAFQGLGEQGLDILNKVKRQYDLAIVTELMDVETLPVMCQVADVVQIGTRNMQNYSLLKALGQKCDKPVLLKRGMCATLDEFLHAAEYIVYHGNPNVILCERGIRDFNNHVRGTLDVSIIPAAQKISHLPIIVDPSHAAGKTDLVTPLALAAVAAGAQGLLVEVHDDPANALCDGAQALHPKDLCELLRKIDGVRSAIYPGEEILPHQPKRSKKMTNGVSNGYTNGVHA